MVKKAVCLLAGLLTNLAVLPVVFAASSNSSTAGFTVGLPFNNTTSYSSFGAYFTDLMTFAIEIAGIFAVGVVVYAGFLYTTSQGDAQRINAAKELVTGSFIGIAILLLIRLILPTLNITGFS